MAPLQLAGAESAGVSFGITLFALGLGTATALLFGLAPALALTSTRPADALSWGSRETTTRGAGGQRSIVALQFALSIVLLVVANLFMETLMHLRAQPLGFDPARMAVVSVAQTTFPRPTFPSDNRSLPRFRSPAEVAAARKAATEYLLAGWIHTRGALERLTALPGIVAAAGVGTAPFTGRLDQARIRAYGKPTEENRPAHRQVVTLDYFSTMGMRILRGRNFDMSDRQGASVAIVSRELERLIFAGNAVGNRLVHGDIGYDIVGVVPNARQRDYSEDDLPAFYVLDRQFGCINHFLLRASGDATAVLPMVRQTIREYDPRMVVTSATTMDELLSQSIAEERFRAMLTAVFGGAALLLSAIGIYSLAARRVSERKREIGVRVAIGACPRDVRALVLRDAWVTVALGVLAGIPTAYAASLVTHSLLFGVSPTAPHVFLTALAVLALVATLAMLLPAHRASHLDPTLTLRE
jgi:predicted permease